jgi:hypothetical protein
MRISLEWQETEYLTEIRYGGFSINDDVFKPADMFKQIEDMLGEVPGQDLKVNFNISDEL